MDNDLNPSAEGVAHGHLRFCPPDCLTDPSQATPCDFLSSNRLSSIDTFWFIHDLPGAVYAADQDLCTPNLTDGQFFGPSFPHAAQELSPGVLCLGQPASHHLPVTEEAALTRFEETLIPHSAHTIMVPEGPSFGKPFLPSKPVVYDAPLPYHAAFDVRDKDVSAASITENLYGFNQRWSPMDMIEFNGVLIDEKEVTCRWVNHGTFCNDPVKGKDLKTHLHLRHDVPSDSQPFTCLWHECPGRPMKKSSLERHMKEQHIPVKWACPTCEKTFTRKTSLMDHFRRCPGRVQPSVTCNKYF